MGAVGDKGRWGVGVAGRHSPVVKFTGRLGNDWVWVGSTAKCAGWRVGDCPTLGRCCGGRM